MLSACPFKGLAYFGDSDYDALLFFGRERESEVVAANLMDLRTSVVVFRLVMEAQAEVAFDVDVDQPTIAQKKEFSE